jgi:hypothetical protein
MIIFSKIIPKIKLEKIIIRGVKYIKISLGMVMVLIIKRMRGNEKGT